MQATLSSLETSQQAPAYFTKLVLNNPSSAPTSPQKHHLNRKASLNTTAADASQRVKSSTS